MFASLNNGFSRLSDHLDFAKLLLRLTFGILMLFHGAFKLQHGVGWMDRRHAGAARAAGVHRLRRLYR